VLTRLSLRARLLLGVVLLTALGLVAADVATYTSLRSFLLHRVDVSLEAGHGRPGFDGGGPPPGAPPPQGVDWVGSRPLAGGVVQGRCLVASCSPPNLPQTVTFSSAGLGALGPRVAYLTVSSRDGKTSYRVRASVEPRDPGVVRFAAASLADVDGTLHRLLLIELVATAAVLAALAGVGLWVVRLGLRPLAAIEATAAAITAGDLSRRVEHPDPQTEVGRVGTALNTMLDRIEASDRRLRRFVADASHELRTPLAAVRAYAELFGRGAASRPEDLERSMTGITREAERMSLLVDDLLLLARLDEGRPLEREPVDLAELVAVAVDAAKAVEPDRPISIELEPAAIVGDRDRLRQALDNLLANVRAHTPPLTPVSVELRRVNGVARLAVADHGPGLTEEQAARIFERFYRADSSRSRASGGVGLGLSIVAAVVEAQGGSVATEPTDGGGATFVVTLPLA
jgi:two-component system OmpR family sensor kinase